MFKAFFYPIICFESDIIISLTWINVIIIQSGQKAEGVVVSYVQNSETFAYDFHACIIIIV